MLRASLFLFHVSCFTHLPPSSSHPHVPLTGSVWVCMRERKGEGVMERKSSYLCKSWHERRCSAEAQSLTKALLTLHSESNTNQNQLKTLHDSKNNAKLTFNLLYIRLPLYSKSAVITISFGWHIPWFSIFFFKIIIIFTISPFKTMQKWRHGLIMRFMDISNQH